MLLEALLDDVAYWRARVAEIEEELDAIERGGVERKLFGGGEGSAYRRAKKALRKALRALRKAENALERAQALEERAERQAQRQEARSAGGYYGPGGMGTELAQAVSTGAIGAAVVGSATALGPAGVAGLAGSAGALAGAGGLGAGIGATAGESAVDAGLRRAGPYILIGAVFVVGLIIVSSASGRKAA